MGEELKAFQEAAGGVGRGAGRKFGRAAIGLGGEYARVRRSEKASWTTIAGELGVGEATAQRWASREVRAEGFRRVTVVDEPERAAFTAVLPGGGRGEGLNLATLIALAKALS